MALCSILIWVLIPVRLLGQAGSQDRLQAPDLPVSTAAPPSALGFLARSQFVAERATVAVGFFYV